MSYRILAKDYYVNNDTHITHQNNNDAIIGGSGSGKTRGYVLPNILNSNDESIIVTDTKFMISKKTEKILKTRGYKIYRLNFRELLDNEFGYNPLNFIRYKKRNVNGELINIYNEQDIFTLCECVIGREVFKDSAYWEESAKDYLFVLVSYVLKMCDDSEKNLNTVIKLSAKNISNDFQLRMKEYCLRYGEDNCYLKYQNLLSLTKSEKTFACVKSTLDTAVRYFSQEGVEKLFNLKQQISFTKLAKEKSVLYIEISDVDRVSDSLLNLFYTQAFQQLINFADKQENSRLPIPVRIYLDDFACNAKIPNFDKIIATVRSRELYVSIILQSISQLKALYGTVGMAETIIDNFDHIVYLGGQDEQTVNYFARRFGCNSKKIYEMPVDTAIVLAKGEKALMRNRYDTSDIERELI